MSTGILDEKGIEIKEEQPLRLNEEKATTKDNGHLSKIMVGDKEYKVVDTVTVMELVVHKLESGQEISQVIAHEFMMVDHKSYMVRLLTDAINTVVKAKKRKNMIKLCSEALFNQMRRGQNQRKQSSGAFGGKR